MNKEFKTNIISPNKPNEHNITNHDRKSDNNINLKSFNENDLFLKPLNNISKNWTDANYVSESATNVSNLTNTGSSSSGTKNGRDSKERNSYKKSKKHKDRKSDKYYHHKKDYKHSKSSRNDYFDCSLNDGSQSDEHEIRQSIKRLNFGKEKQDHDQDRNMKFLKKHKRSSSSDSEDSQKKNYFFELRDKYKNRKREIENENKNKNLFDQNENMEEGEIVSNQQLANNDKDLKSLKLSKKISKISSSSHYSSNSSSSDNSFEKYRIKLKEKAKPNPISLNSNEYNNTNNHNKKSSSYFNQFTTVVNKNKAAKEKYIKEQTFKLPELFYDENFDLGEMIVDNKAQEISNNVSTNTNININVNVNMIDNSSSSNLPSIPIRLKSSPNKIHLVEKKTFQEEPLEEDNRSVKSISIKSIKSKTSKHSKNSKKSLIEQNPNQNTNQILNLNKSNITLSVNSANNLQSNNSSYYLPINDPVTPPLIESLDNTQYDVEMKSDLDFYNPFFLEDNYTKTNDVEIKKGLLEIDEMMNQIKLNDQTKETMRNKADSYTLNVKTLTEEYLNKAYLNFRLNSVPLNSLLIKNNDFKINIVLDLDSTLIFADQADRVDNLDYQNPDKEEIFLIQPMISKNVYKLKFKIRKNCLELIRKLSKICNIFIYTHAQEPYAKEVVKLLSERSGIEIKEENIYAMKSQVCPQKNLNNFSCDKKFQANSLILDDNPKAWDNEYLDNLIHSMKYQCYFNNINFDERQLKQLESNNTKYSFNYLLNYNKIIETNDYEKKFVDENNAPLSLEYEHSKKFQLFYISEFIENVYKLCLLENGK